MPKVFITEDKCDADETIYIVDDIFRVDEKVFVVDNKWDADKKVFVVASKWDADTPISFLGMEESGRAALAGPDVSTPTEREPTASLPCDYNSYSHDSHLGSGPTSDSNPYSELDNPSDGTLRQIGTAIVRIGLVLVAATVTCVISLIVVGLAFAVVSGKNRLTGLPAVMFVLCWWVPPLLVFVGVSGIGELLLTALRKQRGVRGLTHWLR
jgi:hypothetical protein